MRRHDLLDPTPAAWAEMLDVHSALFDLPLVADWVREGRPVIIRRYFDGETTGVPAALPLPPSCGKRRVAMHFPSDATLAPRAPVALREARSQAPAAWQATIDELVSLGAALGSQPRVFGALLWQHLTGLTYLSASSDLDLLWAPSDAAAMAQLVDGLAARDAVSPVRLDGEITLPDGGGVNWRELVAAPDCVLVKTLHSVEMRATAELFA